LESQASTQIQLCGQFAVDLHGRRLEQRLPSRQGRLRFAHLALHRARAIPRDELIDALWPQAAPANSADALTVLLSKLRAVLGADAITGRASLKLALPADAKIDVEEALAAVHRAESAAALGDWARAWSAALCAQFIAQRPLLSEHDLPWLEDWRRRLDDVLQRSSEAYGEACLGIGGCELAGAERTGRRLIALNPLRESGYRLLMQAATHRDRCRGRLARRDRRRACRSNSA
jgi:SARP family transcriptional regulator, regulator of embCAB operon